jgi:hypothetical protein
MLDKEEGGNIMDESFTQEFKSVEKARTQHKDSLVELGNSFNKLTMEEEAIYR